MLKKRFITALVGIPLLIVAIWFDEPLPWLTILLAAWGALAASEFYRMFRGGVSTFLTIFGSIWAALFIVSPHCPFYLSVPTLLTSAIVVSLIGLLAYRPQEKAFLGWAWTMAGILYIGWMLSHFVALRGLEDGRNWVFLALFVTWASDSSAFFIGRKIGRHKLSPNISPGKTWEGAIGGICGAVLMSILFFTQNPFHIPLLAWQTVLLSILVSVFGQLGDLVESLLKRNMGVKDSGSLMPGHGGLLDRMDSVVFAGVVVYYYVIWIIP